MIDNRLEDGSPWLLREQSGNVLTVTLNRPERRNAIAWGQVMELAELLGEAALDPSVRAVVLTGTGAAFSAGGDVKDQAGRREWSAVDRHTRSGPMLDAIEAIWDFPKPLIAAINGVAAGAGVGIALLCDVRIGAAGARLGFAFVRVGLGPDYGVSYTLPLAIGPGHAARLLFDGSFVDMEEALAIGLVQAVHPADRVLEAARTLAADIAQRAPFGVRLVKAGLRRSATADLGSTLRAEFQAQIIAMGTRDHVEGTTAFLEKREPRFEDR